MDTYSFYGDNISNVFFLCNLCICATGSDYTTLSADLTFQPGETDQIIEFETREDTADEPDETFVASLTNPTSGTVGSSSSSTITIVDDDGE